jgi:hypothetical protein
LWYVASVERDDAIVLASDEPSNPSYPLVTDTREGERRRRAKGPALQTLHARVRLRERSAAIGSIVTGAAGPTRQQSRLGETTALDRHVIRSAIDLYDLPMSEGLQQLVARAETEPLPFAVSMYCGQMVVSGRIAPSDWFFRVSKSGFEEEVRQGLRRVKDEEERKSKFIGLVAQTSDVLQTAADEPSDSPADEVTLVDVHIFPAVSTQGTKSGGQVLPVARIPLSAIDIWWIISGEAIRGSRGPGIGFGFLFPIGS